MALAQDTTSTLTLSLYGLDASQSLAASVVNASPNATTLYLSCIDSPSDPLACIGFAYSRTLVTGPSTYFLGISEEGITSSETCVSSTSVVVCDYDASGAMGLLVGQANYPVASVTPFTIAVTAGVDKLVEAEATQTSATQSASATGTEDMITGAPTMTATMTGDAASGSSTGAAASKLVGKEMALLAAACGLGSLWLR